MEKLAHCPVHRKRPVEYVCPTCDNLPLCDACKQEHASETGHALENCKEVGLALMRQCIQDVSGKLANGMAKGLRKALKELEDGILREIDRFQKSCIQTEELRNMQKLDSEGRYAEIYFYAKALFVGGAMNEVAMGELSKRLRETLDKASAGLKKLLSQFAAAAQYKPAFDAYKKDEVLALKGESNVISALKSADMSKFKAVYINLRGGIGDHVASELASCLQTHPVSALYLASYNISDAGAKVLAQAAFRGKSLSAFCIRCDDISDAGAEAVAEAARNSRSLTTLYLHCWKISDFGAAAVAQAVKDCLLSVFHLESGRISDSGATAVAQAVKDCPLSAFCLWGSEIWDAEAIAVAVMDCPLSAFYLGSNKISDRMAASVAEILSSGECASTLSAL